MSSKGRLLFIVFTVIVFIVGYFAGVITGPMTMRTVFGHMSYMNRGRYMPMDFGGPGMGHHGPPPPMEVNGKDDEIIKNHIVDEMGRDLSLSGEQKIRLRKVFDDNEPALLTFQKEMRKRMEEFRGKMDSQILQILDEKQKEKFKKFSHGFRRN
jgi:hypothetical protein